MTRKRTYPDSSTATEWVLVAVAMLALVTVTCLAVAIFTTLYR